MITGNYNNIQTIRPVNSSVRDEFDVLSRNEKSALYLPVLKRVEFQPKDVKTSEENKNNRKKEDFFDELENYTILLKNASSDKKYLREKIKNFSSEWEYLFKKGTSQKKSSSPEDVNDSSEEYSDLDQQRAEKIVENYNRDYFGKLIKKDKDIISALADACRGILNFIEKVASNLSSVSEEKKIQNMTTMKGLVFDSIAWVVNGEQCFIIHYINFVFSLQGKNEINEEFIIIEHVMELPVSSEKIGKYAIFWPVSINNSYLIPVTHVSESYEILRSVNL